MYSEKTTNLPEIKKVIDNLCNDTTLELKLIFGSEYHEKILEAIKNTDNFIIRLKKTKEPVGLFGLIEFDEYSAGIYLLTTDKLHNGNIVTFIRQAKIQIGLWSEKYKLIMDNCYKQNMIIKKWLKLLGFKPSEYQDKDFQIYYKGDINLYK